MSLAKFTTTLSLIYLLFNFSQKDMGHTKGEPILGAPPYTHIHTYIQLQGQNKKNKQKL